MITDTRILQAQDRRQVEKIAAERTDLMGVPASDEYVSAFLASLDLYLDPSDKNHLLIGSFAGDELVCFIGMYFWTTLPCWTLTNLKTQANDVPLSAKHTGIAACYDRALRMAEDSGIYQHYYIGRARGRRGRGGRNAFQRMIPRLRRYEFFIEAVVPAGERPPFAFHWNLMGERTYKTDIAVRFHCLKQQYRETADQSV